MPDRTRRIFVGVETDILRGSGVGNYCFHLVSALIENYSELSFCGFSGTSWSALERQDLKTVERIEAGHSISLPSAARKTALSIRKALEKFSPARPLYRKVRAARFDKFPTGMSLDIFHAFKYLPPGDLNVPILPVVYDLSFVRYPEVHPKDRLRQLERLPQLIERSTKVQTISQFSKAEIIAIYGCPPEKIFVAPPAAAEIFRPLGADDTFTAIHPFELQYKSFLLAVGTLEPRKNLRTLISAYSQLSPATRRQFPLVVVGRHGWGKLNLPPDTDRLTNDGSLRFLGAVTDTQLRGLYEGAIGLLYPSVYEGFGMPVVEALACGTQVAHSSDSSMDEITEGTALTVQALDVAGWITIMNTLIDQRAETAPTNSDRVLRSRSFSWRRSAEAVEQVYAAITTN